MNLAVIKSLLILSVSNNADMNSVASMTVSCILSKSHTTKDGYTLPLSQLEQGGALATLKFI